MVVATPDDFELVLEEDEMPSHKRAGFRRIPTFLRREARDAAVPAPPSEGPTTIEDNEEVEEEEVATPDDKEVEVATPNDKEEEVATPDADDNGEEEEARSKLDDRARRSDVVGAGEGFELSLDDEVNGDVASPVGVR